MVRSEAKLYPISEIFNSPQGEGVYAGVMMTFIRLAGCTVGKPFPKERYEERYSTDTEERPLHLPIYTEKCTLYDGREFACDTDFRVKERLTSQQILQRVPIDVDHVCITGGEPMMHDLSDLTMTLSCEGKKKIHIETSGTINFDLQPIWITVSPKWKVLPSMMERADELKLLVDRNFDPEHFLNLAKTKPVYLQPVNFENRINGENLKLCMEWQKKYPQFRVCLQLHKAISPYIGELVR